MTHDIIIARRQGPSQGVRSKQCGRGELPPDPGLEALLADKNLSATAKLIAVTLVKHWAWYKSSCYPANRSIAERCGKSPGHVVRCLHELESRGWISRECRPGGSRLIWLCWRVRTSQDTPCKSAGDPIAPALGGPIAPARTEQVVIVTREIEQSVPEIPSRSREDESPCTTSVAAPTPSADDPGEIPEAEVAQFTHGAAVEEPRPVPDPITHRLLTPDEMARLNAMPAASRDHILTLLCVLAKAYDPIIASEVRSKLTPPKPRPVAPQTTPALLASVRESPSRPAEIATVLAREWGDQKSWNCFKSKADSAYRGELEPDQLVRAYNAVGDKARNKGAVWMHALARSRSD